MKLDRMLHGYALEWREGGRWEPGIVTIDDSDGQRPAYRIMASCSTCSWKGEIRRPVGVEPRRVYPCPDCECRSVRSLGKLAGLDREALDES